jgi:hypothetical protein
MAIEIVMEIIARLLGVVLVTEFAIIAGLKLLNVEENGKSVKNNVAMMGFTVLGIIVGSVIAFNNFLVQIIFSIIAFAAMVAFVGTLMMLVYAAVKQSER